MKKKISRTLSGILIVGMIVTSLPVEVFADTYQADPAGGYASVEAASVEDIAFADAPAENIYTDVTDAGNALAEEADNGDALTEEDATDKVPAVEGILTGDEEVEIEDTDAEMTVLDEVVEEASDEEAVADFAENDNPETDMTSLTKNNYVTDAAWAVDKNDKDNYVGEGNEYMYSSYLTGTAQGERELFSAIHNDIILGEHEGKWYEGHEVIYYPATGKKVYSDRESTTPLDNAPAFTGNMVFAMKYLPAELSDQFYHFHRNSEDTEWVYTGLEAEKLYAWEYEPYEVGSETRYKRVKTVEITSGNYEVFTETGKKYTNNESISAESDGYTKQITLSGNVVLNGNDFNDASHPIAIVALAYDAAKNAKAVEALAEGNETMIWNNDPKFAMRTAGYGSTDSSIYNRSYIYYRDDIYTADTMTGSGNFSLNPYNYYINDTDNTLTLYGCTDYNGMISSFMRGYKDDMRDQSGSGLIIDTWEIPASYNGYQVVIYNHVDEYSESYNYYSPYPNMTTNLIIEGGVTFPEDCTALLGVSSMYALCPDTITIAGDTASVGSNIKRFSNIFAGGTYSRLDIKALDTSGAEDMSEMFRNVILNPKTVSDLPDLTHFDTGNVTDMSRMFNDMRINASSTAYNVNVSNLNTSNVTDFSHMFDGYRVMVKGAGTAKYFTSVDTTKWDTGKASDMSWMFANMLFMEETGTDVLDLSGLDFTPTLKSMQGMFYGNRGISEYGDGERGLTKIIFPANMDTSGVTDMSLMFANCSTLSQVENFTALDTDNVIDMSEMFGTALEDRLFGSVRYTPEPADTGGSTGSWAEDRLYKGCGVSYYHAYPGDFGPAFSSLDLTNFNTKKVKYAYGMFSNMKNLSEIKWGTNTTFESLTDATYMFILPNMASLDLTGRKISSVKFAHSMMELENADEIILGENSLDLTHIDKSMNGRFSLSAPILSMDFSNVILGAGSFDADSLYNNYTTIYNAASGLDAVEELIFPAGVPVFTAPARLRTTFFDSDSNAYDYYRGGNSKALRLTTSAAGYEITDFKAGNSNYGYGLVGNGGTLDITMGLDEDMIQNNLSALFYVDGNSGIDAAKLTPAPDISWRITAGDAVGIETATITNTNDTVHLKPEKTGTATITLTVNGGEYTATFNATVYDKTAEAKLYSADGSIYMANVLSDGTYMVTGYDNLASDESIDLTGLKLGSASGTNVTVSRIGKEAFSQGGSDYSLRDTMKTLKIPASVTYIGESAFYNMTKLETVTIEAASRLKSIGDRAFSDAGSSNGQSVSYDDDSNPIYTFTKEPFSINLPEGLEIIGDGAFASADLATIVIPSTVKSIGSSCFSGDGCRLTSAVIKTTCLESIPENLFNGKMRLESIKDGDGNDYGFEGCIRIGDYAFYNCMALTGSFSSDSLKYIGKNAFASEMGSGVPITGFTAPNVVQLGENAFERCFKMKTAVFPSLKEIPCQAFDLCSIETLDISSVVTIGQQAFSSGLSMNKVVLPDTLATIGTQAFEMNDTVKEYKLPDSLHTIGAQAFAGNTALGSIIIPDSVTSIASSYNGAFSGCSSLEEATIGSGISEIPDCLFYGCPIKKLTMGNNITAIGNEAFSGAALNEISLPSSLRSIGESAFKEAYYGAVKYGGEAVEGGVSTIIIPYGVTEIAKKNTGDITAFKGKQTNDYRSTYIKELYLPETVQDLSGLDLRVLFKENPADKQLEYMEEGNTTPQHVYTYDGKIYYPGTRSELEAAVFAENKDQNGNTISQGYETYGEYNVLDLFDIEYGTGWKKVNGKTVFYKEGSPVKAEAGGYTVQEAGDYYYLLDENGEYVRDRAYVDKEGTGAGAKYYIYYFGSNGVGERHDITAEAITAESAVYGFFNNTVHAAMKVSGGVPGLVRGVSDVPEAETLSSLKASDGEHKYFAYTDGTLAKGYMAGSANDGYYFDDYDKKDGRLVWYADYSVSSAKYYTDTAKANALGGSTGASFPDKDGNMVTYKNGIMSTLTGDDLSMSVSPAFDAGTSNVTLYTGGDSSETSTEHPSKGTVTLTVSSDKGINLTKAGVRWSISTQFPRTAGMKVLSIKNSTALDTSAGTSTVTFTALSAGTARLRATVTDGDTGVTAYKECVVTVKELDNMPEGVSVTAEKTTLALGGTTTITAELLPENTTFKQGYDKISFTLSGKNAHYFALTDNGNGTADIKALSGLLNDDGNTVTVTIIAAARNGVSGRIRITATSEGGGDNPGPSPSPEPVPVGDEAYVTGVALNKGEASLYPGDVLKLSATVNPANAKDKTVTWATSNADVVTVDNTGKVTAVAAGTDASGSPAAAKAVITATAKGSESGKTVTAACTVTVLPKEIVDTDKDGNIIDPSASGSGVKTKDASSGEANIWVAGIDNNGYYYTGNAIKPAIHVYKGYKLLTEKTDYTLTYKNNKNVSKVGSEMKITEDNKKPQIIIKMKGAYSGSETAYFNIIPMPIDKLTADNDMFSVEYKAGKKNLLKPTLMYDGNKVKYNAKDITFKWYEADESGNATKTESECIEAKTYAVKAFAGESGNYSDPSGEEKSGHKVATVIVSGMIPMSKVKLEGFRNKLAYEGGKAVSQNAILTYKDKGVKSTLSECKVPGGGGDYTVTHMNNYDLGTATVIYEAARDASGNYTGKYSGKVVKTYKIAGKYTLKEGDGGNCIVSLNSVSYPYANAQIKPEVKVTAKIVNNNGVTETRTLIQGRDYTVSYKNNKTLAAANAKKNGRDIAPQVIVKGKGNYVFADTSDMKKGVVKRFGIRKADLGRDVILTISDIAYNETEGKYKKTKLLFTDKDYMDLKLKEGKDYTVSYTTSDGSEAPAAGQSVAVTITAEDGGSCTGYVTGSYRITDRNNTDISKVKVVINPNANGKTQPCTYTGSGIEPKKDGKPDLILTIGSGRNAKTLKPRTVGTDGKVAGDYEILGYYNNIFPGSSAVILIRGIGDYRGIRAVKFKISAVKVANRWGGVYGQSK